MRTVVVVAAAVALCCAPAALAGRSLHVGAVEDAGVWDDPGGQMDLAKLAGFDSVRFSAQWTAGTTAPADGQLQHLQDAALAATSRGLEPIVSIYNENAASTPNDASSRAQFVEFAKTVVTALPSVTTFTVGNEPNTNLYWMPQFGSGGADVAAVRYEQLLAQTYDAIKEVRPDATVIGGALDSRGGDDPLGARQTHSPTTFIHDLGAAYRASGRTAPLMDVWDQHVYADTSALPPSMPHTHSSTVAEGDYGKLVRLLAQAFDGTAQRGSTLPILYGEYGAETAIPAAKEDLYSGTQVAAMVSEATQGRYYAQAFKLALCQPRVIGIMIFHVVDESSLGAWQSGPYYADGTPKSSFRTIRDAALRARAGTATTCPDRRAPHVAIKGPAADGTITARASDAVGVGEVTLALNGDPAGVRYASPYRFAWKPKRAGRYTVDVRAADAAGNVGRARVTVEASRARRGNASTPARWIFRRVPQRHARAQRPKAQHPRAGRAALRP